MILDLIRIAKLVFEFVDGLEIDLFLNILLVVTVMTQVDWLGSRSGHLILLYFLAPLHGCL